MNRLKGIDVSYAQGRIDFDKISRQQAGFAILRSSYGWESGQKDAEFERNIRGFQRLGIPCGAYHYSYARSTEDAVKEAEYCLRCIKNAPLSLPVFLDLEDPSVACSGRRICTDVAKTFCERLLEADIRAGVYLNTDWLERYVFADEIIGKYELWLAEWDTEKPSYPCTVWQYRVSGENEIRGISGECDMDIMYLGKDDPECRCEKSDEKDKRFVPETDTHKKE